MEIVWGDGHLVQVFGYRPGKGTKLEVVADTGNPEALYRYLILSVTLAGSTSQFSAWQFTTSSGSIYRYPSEMTLSWSSNISFFTGEGLAKAVISDTPSTNMGKACFSTAYGSAAYPKYFLIDLHDSPINVKKYSKWHWYTSNDTASESGARNLRSFELFVSNLFTDFDDHTGWTSVDSQVDYQATSKNYSLAYTGNIKV